MRVLPVIFVWLLWLSVGNAYRFLAAFPFHSKSHFIMLEALAKGLADKGHQIDVISPFPQKKPYPNYTDIANLPAPTIFENNMTYEFIMEFMKTNIVQTIATLFGNDICELHLQHPAVQKLVRDPPKDPHYDAMIMEIFSAHCFAGIAHLLNIPLIGISTTIFYPWLHQHVAQPENLAFVSNSLVDLKYPMNLGVRMYNVLHTVYSKVYFNYLTRPQDDVMRKYLGPNVPSIRQMKLALILINTHNALNGIQPMTPAVVQIGGIHIRDDGLPLSPDLQKWMDDSKDGFVYFTFGSMVLIETFPRQILDVFYSSLRKIAPIRVLIKVPNPEKLPPGLPKNIHISAWMPQLKVLKHPNIRAFITHGGFMSTLEAIACGVPLIGIPLYADQLKNIDGYVAKNIAVKLSIHKITEKDMDAALNAILYDPRYNENIKKLSQKFLDQPLAPIDTADYWIHYVIKYGDDVLRSSAMDLTWWQLSLVDVVACLLLCMTIGIALAMFSLQLVMKMIKSQHSSLHLKKTN